LKGEVKKRNLKFGFFNRPFRVLEMKQLAHLLDINYGVAKTLVCETMPSQIIFTQIAQDV